MTTTSRWNENRKEIEEHVADVYPTSRDQDRGADRWTALGVNEDLRAIYAGRWTPETRALLYHAREAVQKLTQAMSCEIQ